MSQITSVIGQRIKNYRLSLHLSQEKLAELANCHPTYIGQIERGEKNATIESIFKIVSALNISLEKLFEKIDKTENDKNNIPLECYNYISCKNEKEQEIIFSLIKALDDYKNI